MRKLNRRWNPIAGVVVLILVSVIVLTTCLPGASLIGSAEIRILVDGKEIELSGTFDFGEFASEIGGQSVTFVVVVIFEALLI